MEIISQNRNGRKSLAGVAAGAMSGLVQATRALREAKQTIDSVKKMRESVQKSRKAPPASKKQSVDQRSSKMAAPTSFGISSNNVIRATMTRSSATTSRFSGVSYLGAVDSGALTTSQYPTVACFASSNPITFRDRLQIHASTYDKFVYHSLRLKYVPAVGTDRDGKVAIAIDRDYTDPPQTTNWGETISYEAVASGSVWAEHSCSIKRDPCELRTYFTNLASGIDIRETEQFKFYAYVQGVQSDVYCGDLYLEYDIELISPVYAPAELGTVLTQGYTQSALATISMAANSNVATISGLPFSNDNSRPVFEVMVNYPLNTTNVKLGDDGLQVAFPNQGTTRFFLRATNNAAVASFIIYPDLPSAINGGQSWFNDQGVAHTVCPSCQFIYRRLTFPGASV